MPLTVGASPQVEEDNGLLGAIEPVLLSERVPGEMLALPRVLSARDLTVLCLIAVFLITNVFFLAGAGGAAFVFFGLGFLFFLIPSALVCAQLYRLFPGEGSVYLWAQKAFGNFWDMLLGFFCHWWAGAFGLIVEVGSIVTYLQALNSSWLQESWQQGAVQIIALLVALGLCVMAQRQLQNLINFVFAGYLTLIVLIGLAGVVWLLGGHPAQGDFTSQGWQISKANLPLFATVILSLLGMEVPLNLGGELTHRHEGRRYLLWATVITIVGYFIATFGILVVLPPQDAQNPALLGEVFSSAFGATVGGFLGKLTDVLLVVYFLIATAAFNLMFSRLLVVTGVDLRAPRAFRRLNQNGVPFRAMAFQVAFNVVIVAILFFLVPQLTGGNPLEELAVFLITINGAGVVWELAMVGLFLSAIVLFVRYQRQLIGRWIAPPFVMFAAAVAGLLASCAAIFTIFFAGSPLPDTLGNDQWVYFVALVVLGSLALGAIWSFLAPEPEDVIGLLALQQPKASMPPPERPPMQKVAPPPARQSPLVR
jgi:amino acid transporter